MLVAKQWRTCRQQATMNMCALILNAWQEYLPKFWQLVPPAEAKTAVASDEADAAAASAAAAAAVSAVKSVARGGLEVGAVPRAPQA